MPALLSDLSRNHQYTALNQLHSVILRLQRKSLELGRQESSDPLLQLHSELLLELSASVTLLQRIVAPLPGTTQTGREAARR